MDFPSSLLRLPPGHIGAERNTSDPDERMAWRLKKILRGNSLVQWLGLHDFTVECQGSVPGQGTKILQAEQYGKKRKKRKGMDPAWFGRGRN